MENFWDKRYSTTDYIYGTTPNQFFKEQIQKITPGKILLASEGEGRNAVYAAKLGWQVDAIDSSVVAKKKALLLADQNKLSINYNIADLHSVELAPSYYDAVGIIFLHINDTLKEKELFYKKLIGTLKDNGKIILELFSKNQLGKNSGGPQNVSQLCSIEQIRKNFSSMRYELLVVKDVVFDEGNFHRGNASVVRFVGIK